MKRRNTPTKQAVIDLFNSCTTALNQEQIETQLQGKMDRATIYRILNNFCEDGMMHKVVGDDGVNYFAMCKTCCEHVEHHHDHFHFRCTTCNQLICLKEEIKISLPEGFSMQDCNCVITGTCPNCQK
ncbi:MULTISPECIES: Fur family transcriptional regulator [unclassified Empedobacter]|uniref:Fur family transcriptional regulator n=1 Tax=unclassified Empedobacter TaxID=2643773 RepID=UPI000E9CE5AB|nr:MULTISPECIES: transcriptional repressor [unclassified Empedobacter]HBX62250.1 transcriptional regulator [Flavobacteriaceae bacterium]